jgi:hypothetical protein
VRCPSLIMRAQFHQLFIVSIIYGGVLLICSCDNVFLALRSAGVNYFACITITTVCNNCYRAHLLDIHVPIVVSIATEAHGTSRCGTMPIGSVGTQKYNPRQQ